MFVKLVLYDGLRTASLVLHGWIGGLSSRGHAFREFHFVGDLVVDVVSAGMVACMVVYHIIVYLDNCPVLFEKYCTKVHDNF